VLAYGAYLADLAIIFAHCIAFLCALTVSLMKARKGWLCQPKVGTLKLRR